MSFKQLTILIVLLLGYSYIGYYLERSEFAILLGVFGLLFSLQYYLWKKEVLSYQQSWYLAIGIRAILLCSLPTLSDDFYRFLWDGSLSSAGINPFQKLPVFYVQEPSNAVKGLDIALFEYLNSPNYFTVYPPICQLIFWLAAKMASPSILGQVIVMRLFIILAEILTLIGLEKLIAYFKVSKNRLWIYGLNPLVVIELTGNLHFEAFMIMGVVWSAYYLLLGAWKKSAMALTIAINAKLLPLILLPLILSILPFRKAIIYYLIIALVTTLAFIPFINLEMLLHLQQSINLYFQSFEFNASIYYLIRWLGYQAVGYNIIEKSALWLSLAVLSVILICSWWPISDKRHLINRWFWIYFVYLLGATVVHPWYILILIAFTVVLNHRFSWVWSALILLSYNAYQTELYSENLWLVGLEYLVVFYIMVWEFIQKKAPNTTLEA